MNFEQKVFIIPLRSSIGFQLCQRRVSRLAGSSTSAPSFTSLRCALGTEQEDCGIKPRQESGSDETDGTGDGATTGTPNFLVFIILLLTVLSGKNSLISSEYHDLILMFLQDFFNKCRLKSSLYCRPECTYVLA